VLGVYYIIKATGEIVKANALMDILRGHLLNMDLAVKELLAE
jgi:hypothetical protein